MSSVPRQSDSRRFSRAPRRPSPALPSARYELLRRVQADARFRQLPARSKAALSVAIVKYADGDGRFWPKVRTWADDVGVSVSTVSRAIRDAEAVGLLRRQPYLRPDGTQGSTTYNLTRSVTTDRPCSDHTTREPTESVTGDRLNKLGHRRPTRTGDTNGKNPSRTGDGREVQGVGRSVTEIQDPVLRALRDVEREAAA